MQHNGKPDANKGGGLCRIILRKPSHFDTEANDGKIGLFVMDAGVCMGLTPEAQAFAGMIFIKNDVGFVPEDPPWTPPPPPRLGHYKPVEYKKNLTPVNPGTIGDWRRFWDKDQHWDKAPPPRPRWTTAFAGLRPGGDLMSATNAARSPTLSVIIADASAYGGAPAFEEFGIALGTDDRQNADCLARVLRMAGVRVRKCEWGAFVLEQTAWSPRIAALAIRQAERGGIACNHDRQGASWTPRIDARPVGPRPSASHIEATESGVSEHGEHHRN